MTSFRSRLLVFGLLAGLSLPPLAEEADVSQHEQRLQNLKQRIQNLQQELAETRDERSQLTGELRDTERRIGRQVNRVRKLDKDVNSHHLRLKSLQEQGREKQALLRTERGALARQIRAAYAMGRQERLKILLNQQDPATVSRVMSYYDYFHRARAARMQRVQRVIAELARTEADIREEQAQLLVLREQRAQELKELQAAKAVREGIIASLNERLKGQGEELLRLQKDEKRLEALLTQLREALAAMPLENVEARPFSQLRGKLPWPAQGRLKVNFGAHKVGNLRWDGVLISAPEGREVRAVHHGRVAFADWLRGFGLLIIIDHGDGFMTLYGHNQSLFKETGEWVEAGETVATVGSSGGRTANAIYFGIRHNGKPVNPKRWCKNPKGDRVDSA